MTPDRRLVPLPPPSDRSTLREKLVLTPDEAAELLGCSRQYVHALIKRGDLRSVKLGRLRRITVAALHELLDRLESEQR